MLSVDSKFLQRSYASYSFPDFSDPGVKQKKALLYVMDKEVTKGGQFKSGRGKKEIKGTTELSITSPPLYTGCQRRSNHQVAADEQMNQREPIAFRFRNLCTNPSLQVKTMGIVKVVNGRSKQKPLCAQLPPPQRTLRDATLEGWVANRREYHCATAP